MRRVDVRSRRIQQFLTVSDISASVTTWPMVKAVALRKSMMALSNPMLCAHLSGALGTSRAISAS